MAIVTFLFVFCIINCAHAFQGLEVDHVSATDEGVKISARQLEAKAINTDISMDVAPTFRRLQADPITPTGKAVKNIATRIEAKAIKGGNPISGLHWPAIDTTKILVPECNGKDCTSQPEEERTDYCMNMGCHWCNPLGDCEFIQS